MRATLLTSRRCCISVSSEDTRRVVKVITSVLVSRNDRCEIQPDLLASIPVIDIDQKMGSIHREVQESFLYHCCISMSSKVITSVPVSRSVVDAVHSIYVFIRYWKGMKVRAFIGAAATVT